eukprot:scaffold6708_cov134-Cylindrotheca_fusiformis.AAC.39
MARAATPTRSTISTTCIVECQKFGVVCSARKEFPFKPHDMYNTPKPHCRLQPNCKGEIMESLNSSGTKTRM